MRNRLRRYRKKPVTIKAMQWDGSGDVARLIGKWVSDEGGKTNAVFLVVEFSGRVSEFYIETLEGKMHITPGDFVVKGVEGEFYPCKPEIFKKTYEKFDVGMQAWVDIED